MPIQVVILAGGQGKRMMSGISKMLHPLAGKPLLEYILLTAMQISQIPPIIVYNKHDEQMKNVFSRFNICWVEQTEPLGNGHALLQAIQNIPDSEKVLVLYGDTPFITIETLQRLIKNTPKDALGLIVTNLSNPHGFGRILRNKNHSIVEIIEEKDAKPYEHKIKEVNGGVYLAQAHQFKKWLVLLKTQNAQNEYYITDIVKLCAEENTPIYEMNPTFPEEILGANDCIDLAYLERFFQHQYAHKLLKQGVILFDPARLDIRGEVQIGRDVQIDVNVILVGYVIIGNNCKIGANTVIRDSELENGVVVSANCVIENTKIQAGCCITPCSYINSA